MIGDWLLIGFVALILWAFYWWLGKLFDAISEMQAAVRRREDAQATEGKGSSS